MEMENEIESTGIPPVSSLRSRFEALAKGKGEGETSEAGALISNNVSSNKPTEGRQSRPPKVSLSPVPSDDSSNNLRRVVSSPASQPTSPVADRTVVGPPSSVSKRISIFEHGIMKRDKETTDTNIPPTPRRTAFSHSPSTSVSETSSSDQKPRIAHIGLGIPSSITAKVFPRSASGSSIQDASSHNPGQPVKAITDVENTSRKLTKRPPPPPPLKKAPLPPPRGLESRASTPSSRSATPSIDISDSLSPINSLGPPTLPSRNIPSPSLPPRPSTANSQSTKSSLEPQVLSTYQPFSPQLPPRPSEGTSATGTFPHHKWNLDLKNPSYEKFSLSVEEPTPLTSSVAPPLPSRGGPSPNLVPSLNPVPKLPPRSPVLNVSGPEATPSAPPLPPRGGTASRKGSSEEMSTISSASLTPLAAIEGGQRRVPPLPTSSRPGSLYSRSPAASRESLALQVDATTGDWYTKTPTPPPPPPRSSSNDGTSISVLPPPTRTVAPNSIDTTTIPSSTHSFKHKDHSFPHLPHHISSRPISKIFAVVKMGGGASNGTKHQSNPGPTGETSPMEKEPTNDFLPPPVRRVVDKGHSASRPSSAGGRGPLNSSASSSDEDGEEGQRPRTTTFEAGVGKDTTTKRVVSKQGEELPDSSRSNRRPPFLDGFQHPPDVLAAHHRPASSKPTATSRASDGRRTEIFVPHQGLVVVSGWWVVVASTGTITVTNMKGGMAGPGGYEDLATIEHERSGAKGVWTIDMNEMPIPWRVDKPRVTAMEFRHAPSIETGGAISRSASKSSIHPSSNGDSSTPLGGSEEGRYLWCGTRDGALFELDVWNGGRLTDFRVSAHAGVVLGIYRLSNNCMATIDEAGKCLVFTGVGCNSLSNVDQFGARAIVGVNFSLSESTPRAQRIAFKGGFAKSLNGRLWTSSLQYSSATTSSSISSSATNGSALYDYGFGDSKSSLVSSLGGSFSSLTNASHRPSHHNHKHNNGPTIHIHDIDNDSMISSRTVIPDLDVGPVTCGTVLPQAPGWIYLGHQGGWVTIWSDPKNIGTHSKNPRLPVYRHGSTPSTNSTSSFTSTEDDRNSTSDGNPIDSPVAIAPPLPPRSRLSPTDTSDLPVCIRKVKVSTSSITSLEAVGSKLWAGLGNGSIFVYDIAFDASDSIPSPKESTTSPDDEKEKRPKPWVVTNVWKAYGDRPVTKLCVDPFGIAQTGKLLVYSVGRDDAVQFWDGLLSHNWIDSEMIAREPSYCIFRPLRLLICTWNVDAAKPDGLTGSRNATFMRKFLTTSHGEANVPDMIVFGLQEVINLEDKKLTAKTVLLGTGKKRADGTISEKVSRHYKLWHDRLVIEVQAAFPSESYIVQHTENMVGLFTCIFVRRSIAFPSPNVKAIGDQAITTVKCGLNRMYGNKGAIVARFTVDDTSFCFLNCHLAAGQHQRVARNMDLAAILEEKAVFPTCSLDHVNESGEVNAYVGGGDGSMILDHEICFLNGDLNYRIDQRRDAVINHVQADRLDHLLQYDQLLHEMQTNPSFRLQTFNEPPITFAPTYKYDRHTDDYDTSEKKRVPAWCDRILYRSRDPNRVRPLWYGRYEPDVSDHRPVCGVYDVMIKQIIPEKRERDLEVVKLLWEKEQFKRLSDLRTFYEKAK
ncbi:hypothetical protein FRC18_001059 [Serendipita sp. 400]|nr:hypothetical protein FRC18_001059 [Serendipita sp. 400]